MLDIEALITHLKTTQGTTTQKALPADWTVQHAWSMQPVDDESLPDEVPIMAFYRGNEVFSERHGSPCCQRSTAALIAVYIVRHSDETARIKQARNAIIDWQKANDRECLQLYLSDDPGMPCGPISITGQYIWQKDVWMTKYEI